ncbi:MAG: PD-(D/E)XK nuclease family protein [Waterburya sp.]
MSSPHQYREGIRYHETPIGVFPGVTSILSETRDGYARKAIDKWKSDLGENEAEAYLKACQKRGDVVHQAIELYLSKGVSLYSISGSNDPKYLPLLRTIEPVLGDISNTRYIEQHTYHPLGYGGSPDLVADYNGKLTIIDWKTSSKPKKRSYIKDYLLQVCAYISSVNYVFDLNIENGLIAIAVEGLEVAQLFEITSKQYQTGWQQFQERLDQFYRKYPLGEF